MKKTLILIIILFISYIIGCVSLQDYDTLQSRVTRLESSKSRDTMLLAEQAGARKFWWRNTRTGGGDALDGISGALLSDGDAAFVVASGSTEIFPYIFKSGVTNDEDGFLYINDNTGKGTWALCVLGVSAVSGYAADGTHYIDASNTANLSDIQDGRCWFAKDVDKFYCGTGSGTTVLIGP